MPAVIATDSGDATTYFATSFQEMSKYTCAERGIAQDLLEQRDVPRDRLDDAPEPGVRPDDGRARMAREQRLHLRRSRPAPCSGFANGTCDVVVDEDDQPDLAREVEDAVERRVGEARDVAGDLRGDELLVDA